MVRIRTAFVSGTTLNNPLAIGDTSLSSAALSSLATITSPDIAAIVLDPGGVNGTPEVVWVTAHTAAATTATISRAAESSTARAHPVGTSWVHGGTIYDITGTTPEWLEPQIPLGVSAPTTQVVVANQAYLYPIRPLTEDVLCTNLITGIGVQSGNVDVGIYSFDGTTFTRVASMGSTACPAGAGRVVFNIADVTLYRGTRYFFALAADNGTVTFAWVTNSNLNQLISYIKATSFPLPSTISTASANGSGTFLMAGSVSGAQAVG